MDEHRAWIAAELAWIIDMMHADCITAVNESSAQRLYAAIDEAAKELWMDDEYEKAVARREQQQEKS